jgi:predicted transcriptional regulator
MFTSYRVIELVRAKISTPHVTASDTQVARAIGISRAAVSAYKVGRDIMTHETLGRAQELLELPPVDVAAVACDLLLEKARTEQERAIYKSLLALISRAGNRAASILLVGLALLTVGGKASAAELDVVLGWDLSNSHSIHYAHFVMHSPGLGTGRWPTTISMKWLPPDEHPTAIWLRHPF